MTMIDNGMDFSSCLLKKRILILILRRVGFRASDAQALELLYQIFEEVMIGICEHLALQIQHSKRTSLTALDLFCLYQNNKDKSSNRIKNVNNVKGYCNNSMGSNSSIMKMFIQETCIEKLHHWLSQNLHPYPQILGSNVSPAVAAVSLSVTPCALVSEFRFHGKELPPDRFYKRSEAFGLRPDAQRFIARALKCRDLHAIEMAIGASMRRHWIDPPPIIGQHYWKWKGSNVPLFDEIHKTTTSKQQTTTEADESNQKTLHPPPPLPLDDNEEKEMITKVFDSSTNHSPIYSRSPESSGLSTRTVPSPAAAAAASNTATYSIPSAVQKAMDEFDMKNKVNKTLIHRGKIPDSDSTFVVPGSLAKNEILHMKQMRWMAWLLQREMEAEEARQLFIQYQQQQNRQYAGGSNGSGIHPSGSSAYRIINGRTVFIGNPLLRPGVNHPMPLGRPSSTTMINTLATLKLANKNNNQ